jgi:hypothetical protein
MRTLPIVRLLDTDGDGTGTKNAVGNYAGAAEDFYIEPPSDEDYLITRLIVHIADGAINEDEYGGLGAALTNGVVIKAKLDGTTIDLTDGVPIKTNGDYGRLAYDVKRESWGATPSIESCHVRWSFFKFFSEAAAPNPTGNFPNGVMLQGHRNDQLIVTLNDSFAGLVDHYFMAEGTKLLDWISASNQS